MGGLRRGRQQPIYRLLFPKIEGEGLEGCGGGEGAGDMHTLHKEGELQQLYSRPNKLTLPSDA